MWLEIIWDILWAEIVNKVQSIIARHSQFSKNAKNFAKYFGGHCWCQRALAIKFSRFFSSNLLFQQGGGLLPFGRFFSQICIRRIFCSNTFDRKPLVYIQLCFLHHLCRTTIGDKNQKFYIFNFGLLQRQKYSYPYPVTGHVS